jgi:hypothetical protein
VSYVNWSLKRCITTKNCDKTLQLVINHTIIWWHFDIKQISAFTSFASVAGAIIVFTGSCQSKLETVCRIMDNIKYLSNWLIDWLVDLFIYWLID